jgi:putative membrane protein
MNLIDTATTASASTAATAASTGSDPGFNFHFLYQLLPAASFALLGMALFGLAWFIVVKVSPFSIRKEIEEDQNTALGIILGALLIGIAIIIAAAVSG